MMKRVFTVILLFCTILCNTVLTYGAEIDLSGMELTYIGDYDYYVNGLKQRYFLTQSDEKGNLDTLIAPKLKAALNDSDTGSRASVGQPVMQMKWKSSADWGYQFLLQENGLIVNRQLYEMTANGIHYIDENGEEKTKPGFVSRKDDSFEEICLLYNNINYTKEIEQIILEHIRNTTGKAAERPVFQTVNSFEKIYEAVIQDRDGRLYHWGLCSYMLESKTCYSAYLSIGNVSYISDFYGQNKVKFDSSRWIAGNQYYSGSKADENFYAEVDFKADKDYQIYDLTLKIKTLNDAEEKTIVADMPDCTQTGSIRNFKGFDFLLEDPQVDYTSFLDNGYLKSVTYRYTENGQDKTISKTAAQLNVDDMDSKIKALLKTFSFSKSNQSTSTEKAEIQMVFQDRANRYDSTRLSFFSDHLVLHKQTKEKNYSICCEYGETNLLKQLEDLFSHWKTEVTEKDVTYVDLTQSAYRPQYTAEFEIELDAAQQQSWIGEVAENGKVACRITYFKESGFETGRPPEGMVTISGNSKSFHLMEKGYSRADEYMRYTTESIGIEKDTPIPNKLKQNGVIALNWKSPEEYKTEASLSVTLYDASQSPLGKSIPVTRKSDLSDLLEKKDTPVTSAPPKGQVFTDVPESHWAYQQIENFYYANLVRGVGGGLCAPEDSLTYEHFGLLLDRLFRYEYENTSPLPARRQDVIVALVKALKLENTPVKNEDVLSQQFEDADSISDENKPFVKIAVENSLVQGFDHCLYPDSSLTRAEAITLLSRGISKVYGITGEDKPEFYRFKIKPEKSDYAEITSETLTEFRLWNGTSHDVLVRDKNRLDGKVQFTFGDNAAADTKMAAVCFVDGNVYTMETVSFDALHFNESSLIFDCNINLFQNGAVYELNKGTRIIISKEDRLITIGTGENKIVFENASFSDGKLPATPEEQPYEQYEKGWEKGKKIFCGSFGLLKGSNMEAKDSISGFLQIDYDNTGTKVRLQSQITACDLSGLQNVYQLELVECRQLTDSEITGFFTVKCNGETIADRISGKITGMDAGLGKAMYFLSDDGIWNIEMYVTEKIE